VLSFKIYKNQHLLTKPHIIQRQVALIDLMPTIQTFTKQPLHQPIDGISLLKSITDHNAPLPHRTFMMESGMLPNQFLTREKTRLLGKKFFTIDSISGKVHLRKEELATLDAQKLYGVITEDWILALYPDDVGYIPITLNLKSGQWSDNLRMPFSKQSPAEKMLDRMETFYQKKWRVSQASSNKVSIIAQGKDSLEE
jgi:arylsulfatase A-like enzyme